MFDVTFGTVCRNLVVGFGILPTTYSRNLFKDENLNSSFSNRYQFEAGFDSFIFENGDDMSSGNYASYALDQISRSFINMVSFLSPLTK